MFFFVMRRRTPISTRTDQLFPYPTRVRSVEVRRARPGLAEPARVGLGRDDEAHVLQRVEDVHGAVLHAILVPGDEAPADPPVERVLPFLVELAAVAVEPLDHPGAHRRLLTQPYGRARSEEHTSELQPLMRISYAVFCLK